MLSHNAFTYLSELKTNSQTFDKSNVSANKANGNGQVVNEEGKKGAVPQIPKNKTTFSKDVRKNGALIISR